MLQGWFEPLPTDETKLQNGFGFPEDFRSLDILLICSLRAELQAFFRKLFIFRNTFQSFCNPDFTEIFWLSWKVSSSSSYIACNQFAGNPRNVLL